MKEKLNKLKSMGCDLKLLVVEDNHFMRDEIQSVLSLIFKNIELAYDGKDALLKYSKNKYDLIITDIYMPYINGIEMSKKIRECNDKVPIIILSVNTNPDLLIESIKIGVSGYILKPLDFEQMYQVLYDTVEKIELQNDLFHQKQLLSEINTDLEQQMIQKISQIHTLNEELRETQREVIFTMGAIGETRSKETGNHVKRVALYSELFARYYGLKEEEVLLLKEASPMHDIGKVGIPDHILNKPSVLNAEEWKIMQTHAYLGYEMLKHSSRDLLKMAATIAYEHHERYDGKGYPRGLKAEQISIYGRITALADVFDALGSDRCYKKAWKDEEIFTLIQEEKGKQFDPKLVDIFFHNLDEFIKIREKYKDSI